jgi:quinol monooxygenase YgiN
MVIILARFTALPGQRERVAELISDYARHVRAAEGTILFEPGTVKDQPDEFVVYEQYQDQEAFDGHLSDPENSRFNAVLGPLIVGTGSTLEFFEPVRHSR